MDYRQLRYFSVLAETCHFGRAAESLHVTSSALSQSMRQLESDLGVVLLNRTTRQVHLTAAGRWLQGEAEQILARTDGISAGIRTFSSGGVGVLRVGITGTAAFAYLPRIARALKKDLPDVALAVSADMLTPAQCEGLIAGALDLGILRPPVVGAGLTTAPLVREPLLLALPVGHRLADVADLSMEQLRDEVWVAYSDHHSLVNRAATRMCQKAGYEPRREHTCQGTSVLLALVAAGLGIAMVPGGVRAIPMAGIVLREIPGSEPQEIVIAWRTDTDDPVILSALRVLTRDRDRVPGAP